MTPDIIIVLSILGVALLLIITEWVRIDLVALLVLVSLAITGLVTPAEAISGFSNPAVVTVWAVLILSAGLSHTGVTQLISRRILKLVGSNEIRMHAVIMLVAGFLSGFMNNIGVASLFLPIVSTIARRKKQPPSKLLLPLAIACMLGGLLTLIGTPTNIIISEAINKAGLQPFRMFDFTPVGLTVMLSGIAFMSLVGRRLLPTRDIASEYKASQPVDYTGLYNLHERMFVVHLPPGSELSGMNLAESRLGSALGLNVVAILREKETLLTPGSNTPLQAGDRLLVAGRDEQANGLLGQRLLDLENDGYRLEQLASAEVQLVELEVPANSPFTGQTLGEIQFRNRYGLIVLAIRRQGQVWRTNLEKIPLHVGDALLAQAKPEQIEALRGDENWPLSSATTAGVYNLEERLSLVHLPQDSPLVGVSLVESQLGETYALGVMGIIREGQIQLMPPPEQILQAGDCLMVKGRREDLLAVEGLSTLQVERQLPKMDLLKSADVGLVEVILSPHTTLAGRTLGALNFRPKYGLNVLAIWREGRAYRTNLRDMPLRFGDALLLYGPREKVMLLSGEPDFIVLDEDVQEPPRQEKIPLALTIMALVLVPVILGWLPIAIAAISGVALMALTGCLTMEESYRAIDWKAIFLIAGMLPLGIALENTGAAQLMADYLIALVGGFGPLAVMAGLFVLVTLASQVMNNAAVAVLVAPIALKIAHDMGVSYYPFLMAVTVSASSAFLTPVGHPANIMIMGPGGYKFGDYIKVGLPLTLVVLVVTLLVTPLIWPF